MYTDLYVTNESHPHNGRLPRIAFFQHGTTAAFGSTAFRVIRECQYGWSHRIRIPWELSFRLVRTTGNTTEARLLKTTYRTERPYYLIAENSTIVIRQSYGGGKQLLVIEQIKGNAFTSVQLYRGLLLIAERPFTGKQACFQLDNTVCVAEEYDTSDSEVPEPVRAATRELDLTGLKTIRLALTGNTQAGYRLTVRAQEKW